MCNILVIEPGATPPFEPIQNMVWNNSHGFGLILRDPVNKRMEVIKRTPVENDPKEIYDLLEDNNDLQRFLHVRNKTEGEISAENQHPFCSYNSNSRQVYFMHNGTLYDFQGPSQYYQGTGASAQKESDSKRFNDEVLADILLKIQGEEGYGDINDPTVNKIVKKFWGLSGDNKGILISNDQGFRLINADKWVSKKFKETGDITFLSSNDTYFDKVIRGPEYDRRKAKEEAEKKSKSITTVWNSSIGYSNRSNKVVELKNIDFKKEIALKDNLKDIFLDSDIYSEEGLAAFSNMTPHEILSFTKNHPEDAAGFFQYISSDYFEIKNRYDKIVKYVESNGANREDFNA